MSRTVQTVKITTDAEKLWFCKNFRKITPKRYRGKLPINAGKDLCIVLPAISPSPFCQAKFAWNVFQILKEDVPNNVGGPRQVCEHQIDID